MTQLALELNDACLVLARSTTGAGEIVAESEGYALLDGDKVLTGDAARRSVRLKPIFAYNRFWRDPGTAELPRANAQARTNADLAFAHLDSMLEPHRAGAEGLLLALPAGHTREQLGLLLGIASECGIAVAGLVDAAVVAVAAAPGGARVLHLDLGLHDAVLTLLEHVQDLRRVQSELLPRHGLLALQERWIEAIAATFVRRTRFDPLHEGRNEQLLWNNLPGWLAALESTETVEAEIADGPNLRTVELTRESLLAATQDSYDNLCKFVQNMCPAGVRTDLVVTDRVAHVPELVAALSSIPSVSVRTLPRGAAALATLAFAGQVRKPAGQIALVTRLAVTAPAPTAEEAALDGHALVPPAELPTHLAFGGRALPISATPLAIGWSVPGGTRALQVPAGPGISREHCRVMQRAGQAWLEDRSTYGTFLNDSPVRGAVALRVGDRVRLGNPGVTLDLIQVVDA